MRSHRHPYLIRGLYLFLVSPAAAAEPFRYAEGRHGRGELRYVDGLPVLQVAGSPEEIGEQVAVLACRQAPRLLQYPRDILHHFWCDLAWRPFVASGRALLPNFPADHRRELEAMVAAGMDADLLVAANTMFDIRKIICCSALVIAPERSVTGGPLLGRNLDFPTLGYLHEYSLVMVVRPEGKHAFVSVGFPGFVGCLSGMNDAGLCVAVLEVFAAGDFSRQFDPAGTPWGLCYRRLLEECTTVEEAEQLLRTMKRTTRTSLAVCDVRGGAVLEVTPRNVVVRHPREGVCSCTNHFCSQELAPFLQMNVYRTLDRFKTLEQIRHNERIDPFDLEKSLHAVNHGSWTLHTMIFEPRNRRLHLAMGSCPSSALRPKRLDLDRWFDSLPRQPASPAVALPFP